MLFRSVLGSVLFGVGWGLVGLCPGPAIENLAGLQPKVIVFVATMIAGIVLHDRWLMRVPEQPFYEREAALVTGNTDG